MINLNSKQRKKLEKWAHNLDPVVIVGGAGVTPEVLKMISDSLKSHELLKIKFNEFKDEKHELTEKICNECDATLVRIIGNIAIVFRQNDDPEKQKYNLD